MAGPAAAAIAYGTSVDLPADERRLAAVLVFVVTYWVTEAIPIPVTALLGPTLCVLWGVGSAAEVYHHFANPIIFVFVGSFVLARAMAWNGLDRLIVRWVFRCPAIARSPGRIRLALGATTFVLSMWISNTAAVAMLFPVVVAVSGGVEPLLATGGGDAARRARSYTAGLMLMTAYAASVGGLATPVGSPPNLIGLGMLGSLAGQRLPFLDWMLIGAPIAVLMFVMLEGLLRLLHPAPAVKLEGLSLVWAESDPESKWGRAQTYTLVAFFTAVVLWVLPGVVALVGGVQSPLYQVLSQRLHEGVVAVLAASLLFLLPVDWKPLRGAIPWSEAVRIDWGTILLFGGGLSLGGLMSSSGLAARLAQRLAGSDGAAGLWEITALATVLAVLLTETTSNTAAASIVVPVAIAVAQTSGVSPVPPALGATLAASLAFVLPVSTPPNAIVYGSGRVSILHMIRAGVLFDLLAMGVLLALLRLLCPLLGWA